MKPISKAIAVVGLIAVALGISMAYIERHTDDVNLAFIPLLIGFVVIAIFYQLITKRNDDEYGKIHEKNYSQKKQ